MENVLNLLRELYAINTALPIFLCSIVAAIVVVFFIRVETWVTMILELVVFWFSFGKIYPVREPAKAEQVAGKPKEGFFARLGKFLSGDELEFRGTYKKKGTQKTYQELKPEDKEKAEKK